MISEGAGSEHFARVLRSAHLKEAAGEDHHDEAAGKAEVQNAKEGSGDTCAAEFQPHQYLTRLPKQRKAPQVQSISMNAGTFLKQTHC